MEEKLLKLHENPQYLKSCCELLNSEWPRSESARLHSLKQSSDDLPLSLVLVEKEQDVIGHVQLKFEPFHAVKCAMVNSLVVRKDRRGKGYGKLILQQSETILQQKGFGKVVLTTEDKVDFYRHLGYSVVNEHNKLKPALYPFRPANINSNAPVPPPPPPLINSSKTAPQRTFMEKYLMFL